MLTITEHEIVKMWRPCSYSPIHSLTGLNHLLLTRGATICVPGMHPHLQVNRVLLLAMSLCIGDPNGLAGGPPLHPAPCPMVTTNVITHHLLTPVPFPWLQVPPPCNILTGQSPCQFVGGGLWRPCSYRFIHTLTGPVGQPFASLLGGQGSASWGSTNTIEPGSPVSNVSLQK
jgi:hypothetical protein